MEGSLPVDGRLGHHGKIMSHWSHYRHSGLRVASQLELPEWEDFACESGEPDVRILLSDEPCPACPADGSVAVGETLRFAVEGIGGWQVEGGHTIRLHPGFTAGLPELRLFTLGSAWGALGYQRGFAMWHGSAVERDGKVILFCGDQGAGKSTMAAAQCTGRARLVADDLSRIEPGASGVVIHPSSARIKLWREAIEAFGWQDRILQRDYYRDDKFHCSVPEHIAGLAPLPLDAIVVLDEAPQTRLESLRGASALEAVMRATLYRPQMLDAMNLWGIQGGLAASILSHVEVWRYSRPKTFAASEFEGALAEVFRPGAHP